MPADFARDAAVKAVGQFMLLNGTNAVGQNFVWRAVQVALDAFETDLDQSADERTGYAVMQVDRPLMVLPTRKLARAWRRYLRREYGRDLQIVVTVVR